MGENITAVLLKLTTHCNFGVHLEEALRDHLVCGLQQETIQRRDGVDVQKGNGNFLKHGGGRTEHEVF